MNVFLTETEYHTSKQFCRWNENNLYIFFLLLLKKVLYFMLLLMLLVFVCKSQFLLCVLQGRSYFGLQWRIYMFLALLYLLCSCLFFKQSQLFFFFRKNTQIWYHRFLNVNLWYTFCIIFNFLTFCYCNYILEHALCLIFF